MRWTAVHFHFLCIQPAGNWVVQLALSSGSCCTGKVAEHNWFLKTVTVIFFPWGWLFYTLVSWEGLPPPGWYCMHRQHLASFPGLSCFCSSVLQLFLGSGRVRKTRKAWEHLSWMTSCGHEVDVGGRGPHSNHILDFIIECSNDRNDLRCTQDRQYLISTVRNSLYGLLRKNLQLHRWYSTISSMVVGHRPPTSTSCPPNVIDVTRVPRPSPFIALFRFMQTEEQKTGEAWEWDKATSL